MAQVNRQDEIYDSEFSHDFGDTNDHGEEYSDTFKSEDLVQSVQDAEKGIETIDEDTRVLGNRQPFMSDTKNIQ